MITAHFLVLPYNLSIAAFCVLQYDSASQRQPTPTFSLLSCPGLRELVTTLRVWIMHQIQRKFLGLQGQRTSQESNFLFQARWRRDCPMLLEGLRMLDKRPADWSLVRVRNRGPACTGLFRSSVQGRHTRSLRRTPCPSGDPHCIQGDAPGFTAF